MSSTASDCWLCDSVLFFWEWILIYTLISISNVDQGAREMSVDDNFDKKLEKEIIFTEKQHINSGANYKGWRMGTTNTLGEGATCELLSFVPQLLQETQALS